MVQFLRAVKFYFLGIERVRNQVGVFLEESRNDGFVNLSLGFLFNQDSSLRGREPPSVSIHESRINNLR